MGLSMKGDKKKTLSSTDLSILMIRAEIYIAQLIPP